MGFLFLFLCLFLNQCATQPMTTTPKTQFFIDKTRITDQLFVYRFVFPNQLHLLILPDKTSPTFAYQTWFRVGSHDELLGKTGLAHLFEHMMFKGTKNYPDGQLNQLLEEAGVQGKNAFTTHDVTVYLQELPKEHLELVAKLESDRMTQLVINQTTFDTEREVVHNERRLRLENNPTGLFSRAFWNLAFKGHPYQWPVIGYEDDLKNLTIQDATQFYERYYSPNNATLIITGDLDPFIAANVIEKYYAHLSPKWIPTTPIPTRESSKAKKETIRLNISNERIILGYPTAGLKDRDQAKILLLEKILSGGASSRLKRALIETNIATTVDAYQQEGQLEGIFIIEAQLQKGKKASLAEKIILKELAKLTTSEILPQELLRAKIQVETTFHQQLQSNKSRAEFLGAFQALAGNFELGVEIFEGIHPITSEDILHVARRFFNPGVRTVIIGASK
jgi:zinc protease